MKGEHFIPGGISPFDIYWKVKNNGQVAYECDWFRGQIEKTNLAEQTEIVNFKGKHYVECYLVKKQYLCS